MSRRLLGLPACALLALVLAAPASAADFQPRIVHGTAAAQGEYPAQGFLLIEDDPTHAGFDAFCGGTLVGTRQFLTAAHCATQDLGGAPSVPPPANSFLVRMGSIDRRVTTDEYTATNNDVNDAFNSATFQNDSAMLTLNRPAPYEPMRVVDDGEDALWAAGTTARIIGWGTTSSGGTSSNFLLKADVPDHPRQPLHRRLPRVRAGPERRLRSGHDGLRGRRSRHPALRHARHLPGRLGGPLLVPDGDFFADAGIVSWGNGCADPANPGVYSRIGDNPLNSWVHSRTPEADFDLSHQPRANEPVTLTSTSHYPQPEGDGYFDTVRWDLNGDGKFGDLVGKSVDFTFTKQGEAVIGIQASHAATPADVRPPSSPSTSGPTRTRPSRRPLRRRPRSRP